MHIKKGDTVYVRAGQEKGKTGKVLHVFPRKMMVLIEGVNMRKKHQRPTQKSPKGGVISLESPVHISNIGIYSSTLSGPTRVSMRTIEDGGKKSRVRICRKTGEQI
ncbi:MAG: 50S ribosomal protein L24 [bacterium]|nr:50S ribosomal protein L24 [bacterium]